MKQGLKPGANGPDWTKFSGLDEIKSFSSARLLDIAMGRMREILAGASVVILLLALLAGYAFYKNRQETKSSLLLADAISSGQQAEKETALLKDLVQKYGDSEAAKQALLILGAFYRDKGETDQAIDAFSKARKMFPEGNALFATSSLGLGYLDEGKKLYDDAKKNFKSSGQNKAFEPLATLDLARVLAESGHRDEALESYNRYISLAKESPQLDFVHYEVTELSKK